jgi:hypothetical protein
VNEGEKYLNESLALCKLNKILKAPPSMLPLAGAVIVGAERVFAEPEFKV